MKTVTFNDQVTSKSIIELVKQISALRDDEFYQEIELEIESPGGDVNALNYFLDAREEWKRRGVTLTTKALTSCASAGAIMLSLGDVRKATPSSQLTYHYARLHLQETSPLTRAAALAAAASLDRVDRDLLQPIVERASGSETRPHQTEFDETLDESDNEMLRRMARRLIGEEHEGNEQDWVQNWIRTTDAEENEVERRNLWTELYDTLFAEDRQISSRLAKTLRLIDMVENPGSAREESASGGEIRPAIRIEEWKRAFPPHGDMPIEYLKRHTLILGETGSGKTASGILPMLKGVSRSSQVGAVLVIDPKREIGESIRIWAKAGAVRLIEIDSRIALLDLMEGEQWSIREMIDQRYYWSAAEHVLKRIAGLSTSTPAKTLLGMPGNTRDPIWDMEATKYATALLAVAIEWISRIQGDDLESPYRTQSHSRVEGSDNATAAIRNRLLKEHARRSLHVFLPSFVADGDPRKLILRLRSEGSECNPEEALQFAQIVDWLRHTDTLCIEDQEYEDPDGSTNTFAAIGYWNGLLDNESETGTLMEKVRSGETPWTTKEAKELLAQRPVVAEEPLEFYDSDSYYEPDDDGRRKEFISRDNRVKTLAAIAPAGRAARTKREDAVAALEKLLIEFGSQDMLENFQRTTVQHWYDGAKTKKDFELVMDEAALLWTQHGALNVLALAEIIFNELGQIGVNDPENSELHVLADDYKKRAGPEDLRIGETLRRFADMRRTADRQYMGVYGTFATVWSEFVGPHAERTLFFGCEPSVTDAKGGGPRQLLSFKRAINEKQPDIPTVYCYQPRDLSLESVIAKACKGAFFETILGSKERATDGDNMPIVGYVADEFHRFVTGDPVHGEQSFFDVCRSFGAFAIVASQSVASLQYALANMERDTDKRKSAIDIIFNNTANKIFFRSTDKDTADRIEVACPVGTNGKKAVVTRPASTLGPGECYAALADGRFDRIQLEQYRMDEDSKGA